MADTEGNKKPIYKKWWFWVIIGVIVILIIGFANQDNKIETPLNETGTSLSETEQKLIDLGATESQIELMKEYISDFDDIYNVQIWKNSKQKLDGNGSLDLWATKQNYRVDIYNNEISGIFSYKQADEKNFIELYNAPENDVINSSNYVGKESLLVYHELKNKGYTINLDYANKDNQVLYNNCIKLFETYKDLDPNNENDRLSVDAYKVKEITQNGNTITIIIE